MKSFNPSVGFANSKNRILAEPRKQNGVTNKGGDVDDYYRGSRLESMSSNRELTVMSLQ